MGRGPGASLRTPLMKFYSGWPEATSTIRQYLRLDYHTYSSSTSISSRSSSAMASCCLSTCSSSAAKATHRPPGNGGGGIQFKHTALHRGGQCEHCAALAVVTPPTPDLLLLREQVTECSSPAVDHPALPVEPCSEPRMVQSQCIWCTLWCCLDQFLPWTGSDAHLQQC